jgi:predicted PhzF superfamily epimerase YddE/YHI9
VTATLDGTLTWLALTRPRCRHEPLSAFARGVCPGEPAIDAATAGGADGYRILSWPDGTDLHRLRPDVSTIRDFDGRALIITADRGEGRVALRYFAPQYGNDEDAATGSACVVLADYWQRRRRGDRWRMLQQSAAGALFHVRAGGEHVHIGAICAVIAPGQK